MLRLTDADATVDASRVLTFAEALKATVPATAFVCGVVAALLPGLPSWAIIIAMVIPAAIVLVMVRRGFYWLLHPHLTFLGRLWAPIAGAGLCIVTATIVVFIYAGWQSCLFWIAGWIVTFFAIVSLDLTLGGGKSDNSVAESAVFEAYRHFAKRLGVTTGTAVSTDEVALERWKESVENYKAKHPKAAHGM
jgi:hypothetical protein